MKCDNIKKLIHLNTELSERDQELLNAHLNACNSCRELMKSVENTEILLKNVNKIEPELTYPQLMTSNILHAIKHQDEQSKTPFSFESIFELLVLNKVKVIAYSVVICLIGLFSYQQLSIMNKLNQMEKKIALKSHKDLMIETSPFFLNNKILKEFVSGIENEQIIIDKRSMDRFIDSYKDLKTNHNELLEFLNDNIENLEKKLSKKDIQKLQQLLKEDDLGRNSSTNL